MLPTVARIKRRPKGSIDGSDRLTAHRLSAVPILLIGAFLGLALATYWQMYRRNGGREDNRPTAEVEPMKPAGSGQEVAIRNRLIALLRTLTVPSALPAQAVAGRRFQREPRRARVARRAC
jgi:hypothetical protein